MEPNGTRRGKAISSYDPLPVEQPATPRTYHVFVILSGSMSNAADDLEYPGLVLAWRRALRGWEAQVIYVTPKPDRADDATHIIWVPAHKLRPV